jgi:tetratricopeptide (TPR) repeat protein
MKKMSTAILAILGLVLLCSQAFAQDAAGAIAKADDAWTHRDNLANIKNSIPPLEDVYKKDTNNFDVAWRLSRAYFWLADQTEDKKLKADWGKTGMEYGQKAMELKPDKIEGYYFMAISLGMYSEAIGIMKGLKEGLKGKFDKALDKALALDANYEGGGPIRTKGRSYYRLPGIAGGSNKKAIEWLEKSLKVDPTRLRTKYYIAVVYEDNGGKEKELARKLCNEIIAADPKNGDYPDNLASQKWAKELLKKISE